MKTSMQLCGMLFQREPAWIDRTADMWTMADHCGRKGTVLQITLKRRRAHVDCTISCGPIGDRGQVQNLKLTMRGRSYKSTLLATLDVARYPLQLLGFSNLGIGAPNA